MRVNRPFAALLLILQSAFLLLSCSFSPQKSESKSLSRSSIDYFGTVIIIDIYDENASESLLDDAMRRIEDIHLRMSAHEEGSEVYRLSNSSDRELLSPDTVHLISLAADISKLSDGAFDITIAPLVELWDISGENPSLPPPDSISNAQRLVDYRNLIYSEETLEAEFLLPMMKIDLGSIAKGYACDEAVRILRENNVKSALLDIGGNVYPYGRRSDGNFWCVGLRTPIIGESEKLFATLELEDVSIVTSGAYERYFESDAGEIFHHIIDPKTGYPAKSDLLASIIVSQDSALADALSTACFVLGFDEGLKLTEIFDNVESIFVLDDMSVYVSEGLRSSFELKDSRFELIPD